MLHLSKRMMSLAGVGLVSLVSACLLFGKNAYSETEAPVSAVTPVKLMQVPDTLTSDSFHFVAQVEANDRAQLAFQVPGEIQSLPVRMGQNVSQGEQIANLDPNDYQLSLEARQAEYDLAKAQLARAKQLSERRLVSEDMYDQARTSFTAAEANLEKAKTQLSYTKITAPFDGVVSLSFAKQHQFVGANQPVLAVVGRNVFDINFSLPVSVTKRLPVESLRDASYWVTVANFAGTELAAEFEEISTQPDPDTNSYNITLSVDRPEHLNFLPGMAASVSVRGEEYKSNWRLPTGSIVRRDGQQVTVFQYDPITKVVNEVIVTLDENGEVLGGLKAGEQIVQVGANQLQPGQRVRPLVREGGI